jgi:hypothetical protein
MVGSADRISNGWSHGAACSTVCLTIRGHQHCYLRRNAVAMTVHPQHAHNHRVYSLLIVPQTPTPATCVSTNQLHAWQAEEAADCMQRCILACSLLRGTHGQSGCLTAPPACTNLPHRSRLCSTFCMAAYAALTRNHYRQQSSHRVRGIIKIITRVSSGFIVH